VRKSYSGFYIVVYVSETGRIVNILFGRTCARYDQFTDLTQVY